MKIKKIGNNTFIRISPTSFCAPSNNELEKLCLFFLWSRYRSISKLQIREQLCYVLCQIIRNTDEC